MSPQSEKNGKVHAGDNLMSLTCNLEASHAVYVQARIDHPTLVTGFHGTRPELHQHVHQRYSPKENVSNGELTECHAVNTTIVVREKTQKWKQE